MYKKKPDINIVGKTFNLKGSTLLVEVLSIDKVDDDFLVTAVSINMQKEERIIKNLELFFGLYKIVV
jgi:hypothetical protein